MSFYTRVVFPRLCDFVLNRPFIGEHRQKLLKDAHGSVLEIGFGTGLNLPYYPAAVRQLATVEPSLGMLHRSRRRIVHAGIELDAHVGRAEQLPFPDLHFDCVVSTFTLCSIDEVARAVAEAFRVLKPGGRFLFLEHGLSPNPDIRTWQRRLNGIERWLADGCRLDRDMRALVAAEPFAGAEIDEFDLRRIPRTHGHLFRGCAIR